VCTAHCYLDTERGVYYKFPPPFLFLNLCGGVEGCTKFDILKGEEDFSVGLAYLRHACHHFHLVDYMIE
jgi:hypothetical protein